MRTDTKGLLDFKELCYIIICLAIPTLLGYLFTDLGIQESNIIIAYILGVLFAARLTKGYLGGIICSIFATLIFNYFFTAPYYTFRVDDPGYLVTFIFMTCTAVVTSTLTGQVQKSAQREADRANQIDQLYRLTSQLSGADTMYNIGKTTLSAIANSLNSYGSLFLLYPDEASDITCLDMTPNGILCSDKTIANLIDRTYLVSEKDSFFWENSRVWPLRVRGEILGFFQLPLSVGVNLNNNQLYLLQSMINNTAMAIDRLRSQREKKNSF